MEHPYKLVDEFKHKMQTNIMKEDIIHDFQNIINKYSLENDSNTPDFILVEHLFECLMNAHSLICKRTVWYNPTDNGLAPQFNNFKDN